jgi:hypothetical protein
MDALYIRAVPRSDLDVDQDSGFGATAVHQPASVARVGCVGPGAVLDTPISDNFSPDALPSYFGPGGMRQHRVFTGSKFFACPVYSSARRRGEDHVFDVWIPSEQPSQYWLLRGVHAVL